MRRAHLFYYLQYMINMLISDNRHKAVFSGICVAITGFVLHKCYTYLIKKFTDLSSTNRKAWVTCQRRVLVLGLPEAGKTRLVHSFLSAAAPKHVIPEPHPTIGFETHTANINGVDFLFWDVSGNADLDCHGPCLLATTDILVWVVDSSRSDLIQRSHDLLHATLHEADLQVKQEIENKSCQYLYGIPVILVAAKQDVLPRMTVSEISKRMGIEEVRARHKVFVIGASVPNLGHHRGLLQMFEAMAFAKNKRYHASNEY